MFDGLDRTKFNRDWRLACEIKLLNKDELFDGRFNADRVGEIDKPLAEQPSKFEHFVIQNGCADDYGCADDSVYCLCWSEEDERWVKLEENVTIYNKRVLYDINYPVNGTIIAWIRDGEIFQQDDLKTAFGR